MTKVDPYYSDIERKDLILRDVLAADRTVLANERTFLAYIRTAIAFLLAGATFMKFFDSFALTVVGWIFIPLTVATLLVGLRRYRKIRRSILRVSSTWDNHPGKPGEKS